MDKSKLYNPEWKERYLKVCGFEDPTVELIEKNFISTNISEKQFGKDVAEFTQAEAVDYLQSLNSKSPRRLQTTCSFLSNYFLWCFNEGLITSIINPFDSRMMESIIKDLIPKEEISKRYFTKEEFEEMLESSVLDYSNKFIAYSLYLGITPDEIVNIKIGDLDQSNNKLTLNSGRTITVNDNFKHIMIKADEQTHYFSDGVAKYQPFDVNEYMPSEYVLKTCGNIVERNVTPVPASRVTRRMVAVRRESGIDLLTIPTLFKNGLINFVKEQYEKEGITLKYALSKPAGVREYPYDKQTEKYMAEFGSKMTARSLRKEIKDFIDQL